MKDVDLISGAVSYLAEEHKKIIAINHEVEFSAKHVADVVRGYAGSIGRVAGKIILNLQAMDISCEYDKNSTPKKFILYGKKFVNS